jgi:hypothetical protein
MRREARSGLSEQDPFSGIDESMADGRQGVALARGRETENMVPRRLTSFVTSTNGCSPFNGDLMSRTSATVSPSPQLRGPANEA